MLRRISTVACALAIATGCSRDTQQAYQHRETDPGAVIRERPAVTPEAPREAVQTRPMAGGDRLDQANAENAAVAPTARSGTAAEPAVGQVPGTGNAVTPPPAAKPVGADELAVTLTMVREGHERLDRLARQLNHIDESTLTARQRQALAEQR